MYVVESVDWNDSGIWMIWFGLWVCLCNHEPYNTAFSSNFLTLSYIANDSININSMFCMWLLLYFFHHHHHHLFLFFFFSFGTDQKRTRPKPKVTSANMNNNSKMNNPPASANGSSHNIHANNNQYTKSMDDWLNSNCNNGNATNDANRSSHLDDWLNATMKDSPKTFSVSSTEFLDGPPRNVINSNGLNTMGMVMPPINLLRMMPDYQVTGRIVSHFSIYILTILTLGCDN